MRHKSFILNLLTLFVCAGLYGHSQSLVPATVASSTTPPVRAHNYIDPLVLHLDLILSPPPAKDSAITAAELTELHRVETVRTPAQVALAKADDGEEDIFIFANVLGPRFSAEALPLTAALSGKIRKDESAASSPLKGIYRRSRPYQVDSTLHPVCPVTVEANSYPSGHSLSGYLLAFTLVQLVPEKRQQILDRADEYAHNRLICGVHFASDIAASRNVALAIYGSLSASSRFQQDLAAAREETRHQLGLAPVAP